MNRIDLDGRCAVITGGAQGIGRAVAERFLASGASVALWDRDEALLDEAHRALAGSGTVIGCSVDITSPDQIRSAFDRTVADLGKVDILICNAGIAGATEPTWTYPIEEWRKVIDINLTGVFLCCHTVVPHMIERGYGRIVNVASIAGKEGNPNASGYSAAKAGVIALTKSLAKEVATHDIAVNCITPAAARTRIFDQITQQHIDYMLAKIPRGRFVTVEEIAATVAFAASQDNSFTTGAVFDLSGGRATY
jgi:3-oxoacyl-[acyl-carrier protein] reductase